MSEREAETQICADCGVPKPLSAFGWSKRKNRPTKRCIECWQQPGRDRIVAPLVAIYAELEMLMAQIKKATFDEMVRSEWDEQALRLVMRALLDRAQAGDREAAKLIIDTRLKLKAQGEGEDDTLNLAALLAEDPLVTGSDSE